MTALAVPRPLVPSSTIRQRSVTFGTRCKVRLACRSFLFAENFSAPRGLWRSYR